MNQDTLEKIFKVKVRPELDEYGNRLKESDIEINSTSLARLEGDVKVIGSELQSISQSLGVISNKVDFIYNRYILVHRKPSICEIDMHLSSII